MDISTAADVDDFMRSSIAGTWKPHHAHVALPLGAHLFGRFRRWHVETQERLFGQLRQLWDDIQPRVMVDLGCHAGHTTHKNFSDAHFWLQHFNHTGGAVLGIDIFQDFVDHFEESFLRPPYSKLAGVTKRGATYAISASGDGLTTTNAWKIAAQWLGCCGVTGEQPADWCSWVAHMRSRDHLCSITRSRLGLEGVRTTGASQRGTWRSTQHGAHGSPYHASRGPTAAAQARVADAKFYHRWRHLVSTMGPTVGRLDPLEMKGASYDVRTIRADAIWSTWTKRHRIDLQQRRIDFLKIDVDTDWKGLGLEGLFEQRAFRVLQIEVDDNWGEILRPWNVSSLDQLVWFARQHEYAAFIKVPCVARASLRWPERNGGWSLARAMDEPDFVTAWLHPLGRLDRPFKARQFYTRRATPWNRYIQDVVLLDARDSSLTEQLPRIAEGECERSNDAPATGMPPDVLNELLGSGKLS